MPAAPPIPAAGPSTRRSASYDREDWFRVPTDYDGTVLTIRHTPQRDAIYYAYFAPYSMERHADLVARALRSQLVRLEVLGPTLDGQDLDLLRIGTPGEGKRVCWIVGRQHPGETMAEWWMEGFLERLLDGSDALARAVLKGAQLKRRPQHEPDGSRRGHLRTNAAGANLNREWQAPTMERSPEVFLVRRAMAASGVDYCLDVHGDETRPYNFLISTAGIPSFSEKQKSLYLAHGEALKRADPDFQTALHGNLEAKPGSATMTMCGNWVAETFSCSRRRSRCRSRTPSRRRTSASAGRRNARASSAPVLSTRWRRCSAICADPSTALLRSALGMRAVFHARSASRRILTPPRRRARSSAPSCRRRRRARYSIASAMSSGCARRPQQGALDGAALALLGPAATRGVSTSPGATALTRTSGARARARLRVRLISPALLAA